MKAIVSACFIALTAPVVLAQTPTPEIPNPSFGDIAAVFPDFNSPTGAVIVYNPQICQSIGQACLFFKIHEHCHVYLQHHFQPGIHPTQREADADRCAAANTHPQAVLTTWNLFMNGGSSSDWHTYGSPYQRANRLCNFAMQAGNWIGPTHCP